jgi:DNA-binding transcriptional LysR family regulator
MKGGWDGLDEAIAVADAGSFVKAAARLGSSTSHISRAVAALEARLGVQLFQRTTRSVALTEAGGALIAQFRRLRDERDDAIAALARAESPRGLLRITCPVALGERFVAPALRPLLAAYPDLAIQLDLSNRVADIVGEGFDLAIRTGDLADSPLIRSAVGSRRVLTCAAPSYLAARANRAAWRR